MSKDTHITIRCETALRERAHAGARLAGYDSLSAAVVARMVELAAEADRADQLARDLARE